MMKQLLLQNSKIQSIKTQKKPLLTIKEAYEGGATNREQ